jgi:hypothetical protein
VCLFGIEAYIWDELVPLFAANQFVKKVDKSETLLVWNAGESIIRVLSFQIHDQLGKVRVISVKLNRLRERLPSDDGREIKVWLSMTDRLLVSTK